MAKEKKQPKYQVQVKANVYFYSEVAGETLEEALTNARTLDFDNLWSAPGDIIDTEMEIEGVGKA